MIESRPAITHHDSQIEQAYASCARVARAHYENFPVASLLLPPAMRRHVAAVYAFARAADDFADEGSLTDAERLLLLDRWHARLHDAVASRQAAPTAAGEPPNTIEIFRAVGATIREKALPVVLFDDLLSAFRQDVTVHSYETWPDLLDYCRRSANPVGRLVLRIAGRHDERLDAWSDAICTALQLTNFWQDLRIDFDRGRVYVPSETMRACGATIDDLEDSITAEWKQVLADVVSRTRDMFDGGRPLCDAVAGRLRHELRATWLGGVRILDRLQSADYNVIAHRPSLGIRDAAWVAWRVSTWPTQR